MRLILPQLAVVVILSCVLHSSGEAMCVLVHPGCALVADKFLPLPSALLLSLLLLSCTSGASCKPSCKPCGRSANGQRCWDYLSHRLKEINQLRSEDDEQEPILVSKLNCLQVGATTWGQSILLFLLGLQLVSMDFRVWRSASHTHCCYWLVQRRQCKSC